MQVNILLHAQNTTDAIQYNHQGDIMLNRYDSELILISLNIYSKIHWDWT